VSPVCFDLNETFPHQGLGTICLHHSDISLSSVDISFLLKMPWIIMDININLFWLHLSLCINVLCTVPLQHSRDSVILIFSLIIIIIMIMIIYIDVTIVLSVSCIALWLDVLKHWRPRPLIRKPRCATKNRGGICSTVDACLPARLILSVCKQHAVAALISCF